MRAFLLFVLIAGLGGWFFYQKQNNTQPEPAQSPAVMKSTPAPQLTPAPRGQASEYNWMKRALDRAADVRDQARRQTKESQDP
jgi:hypothetical protein